jgi:hypothetical protein
MTGNTKITTWLTPTRIVKQSLLSIARLHDHIHSSVHRTEELSVMYGWILGKVGQVARGTILSAQQSFRENLQFRFSSKTKSELWIRKTLLQQLRIRL